MQYFSTLCKVIYSLNLDLANKCVPLKISTAPLFYIIFYVTKKIFQKNNQKMNFIFIITKIQKLHFLSKNEFYF